MINDKLLFFNSFLNDELESNISRYNIDVSDEVSKEKENTVFNYFHSLCNNPYGRVGVEFKDEYKKNISVVNLSRQRKRILYMVRVYKEYELGANLRSKVKAGADLYRFYVSSDTAYEGKEQTYISDSFFAAETDEGFKIIGVAFYYDQTWWHAVWEIYQIHPGLKATEIIRLEEPIDDDSKKIYYSEEEMPIIDSPR